MPIGPGKYDDICTTARKQTGAQGCLLIILGGDKGNGFSCQADPMTTFTLPDLLEDIARQIRRDFNAGKV